MENMAPEHDGGTPGILARWSRVSLRAKGVAAMAVPMAALFVALFSIYVVENEAGQADQIVVGAYETRAELLQFHIDLLDADSAVDGYLATGDARFLSSYEKTRAALGTTLERLSLMVSDDPPSVATVGQLKRAAGEAMSILEQLRSVAPASREPLLTRGSTLRCETVWMSCGRRRICGFSARGITATSPVSVCSGWWWCAASSARWGRCSCT